MLRYELPYHATGIFFGIVVTFHICFFLLFKAGVTGAAMSGVVAGDTHKAHTGIPVLHAGSHFRHGLLQLMIHTIDPLHDGKLFSKDCSNITLYCIH